MGQIDMNEVKTNTSNSTKVDKSKQTKPAKTTEPSAELTDNTSEKAENTNEIAQKASAEDEANGKVVITYVGGGIWRDGKGKLWASENKSANIVRERQFTTEEYEEREDIKFMVGYGAMRATHVK